jgi:hypothetical protein
MHTHEVKCPQTYMGGRKPETPQTSRLLHQPPADARKLVTRRAYQCRFGQISGVVIWIRAGFTALIKVGMLTPAMGSSDAEPGMTPSGFWPSFKVAPRVREVMERDLEERLREAGEELTDEHENDAIRAVIEEVENLDDPTSQTTADLLRTMTGIEGENPG